MTQDALAPQTDAVARIIVLLYAQMEDKPIWIFVAVKPTQYKGFLAAKEEGTINIQDFTGFGEVIVAGHGLQPPDEVTLKVAQVYQTDVSKLFNTPDPEAEVAQKMQEHEEKQKKKGKKEGT
jgi:hypothetical protein